MSKTRWFLNSIFNSYFVTVLTSYMQDLVFYISSKEKKSKLMHERYMSEYYMIMHSNYQLIDENYLNKSDDGDNKTRG